MTDFDHAFLSPVLLIRGMTACRLPDEVDDAVRAAPTRRVIGTMNGEPFRAAVHSSKQIDFRYLMLSKSRMKELGLEPGALVEVEMSVDPDPDFVETGEELKAALEADAEAKTVWNGLTAGMRRGIAYPVTSAKRSETRASRAAETVRKLREGTHERLKKRW